MNESDIINKLSHERESERTQKSVQKQKGYEVILRFECEAFELESWKLNNDETNLKDP